MTGKVDLKKTHESYQARRGEFRLLQVPPMQYLMLDGSGDPNSSAQFSTALETLYPVAYTLKFASKNHLGRDYVVPPLESGGTKGRRRAGTGLAQCAGRADL